MSAADADVALLYQRIESASARNHAEFEVESEIEALDSRPLTLTPT